MSYIIDEERQRILDEEGHLLIEGGPGCGKTTIALKKAIKYVEDKNLSAGKQVLFLSFSRSAVTRIYSSSKTVFENKELLKFISIHTFHSFFLEIIRTHGYLLGAPRKINLILPHEVKVRMEGLSEQSWTTEKNRLFVEDGLITFEDFAEKTLELLTKSEKIRKLYSEKYPLIIVDEAQDTKGLQWSCIEQLSHNSTIIALADLDQQIHDYDPDVTPERISDIRNSLSPVEVSLANQNYRSNGLDIDKFARDILFGRPRQQSYSGISTLKFNPKAIKRDVRIRQSIGILNSKIRALIGKNPESIAILSTQNNGVKIISRALQGNTDEEFIPHKVVFDEDATIVASELVAFILEPKSTEQNRADLIEFYKIMVSYFKLKSNVAEYNKLARWITTLEAGGVLKIGKSPIIEGLVNSLSQIIFSGDPYKDWLMARRLLEESGVSQLVQIANQSSYLMMFSRGRFIADRLSKKWVLNGSYAEARTIVKDAIREDKVLSKDEGIKGVHVMNFHQAKGKEFDGVILFDCPHSSPSILKDDLPPYLKSKKLLFVGITRSKYHTLLLGDITAPCVLTIGFNI